MSADSVNLQGNGTGQRSETSRTAPRCSRCLNHGLTVGLRYHKRYCPYRDCDCGKCKFTSLRQRVMAREIASRRARIEEESRSLRPQKVSRTVIIRKKLDQIEAKPNQTTNSTPAAAENGNEKRSNKIQAILPAASQPSPPINDDSETIHALHDHYWDLAEQMARRNGFSDEAKLLLCALIKSRNGNVDEAQELLDEGMRVTAEKSLEQINVQWTQPVTTVDKLISSCLSWCLPNNRRSSH